MATVEKADIGMFDDIHTLLKEFNNPRLGANEWRGLFTYPWIDPCEPPGYVLTDKGVIVGYLGTIYSRRMIAGATQRFCNVSSWIVQPEFRGESIKMVLPLVRMGDCTVTNFSPSPTVERIFQQLGFEYLDTHALIFYPGVSAVRLLTPTAFRFITDRSEIRQRLSASDRILFDHHSAFQCGHLLFARESDGMYCYCIYTDIIRNRLHFNHLHYISCPEVFREHAQRFGLHLCVKTHSMFMKVDCRLLGASTHALPGSIRFRVTSPRMFKSHTLSPAQVDALYSELLILNI
ncbi:MAG TPA: hypothetical protein VK470_10880 [Bacteroidota bacterium]|nr:hypothetical protein [Bacteroidota bacterium]